MQKQNKDKHTKRYSIVMIFEFIAILILAFYLNIFSLYSTESISAQENRALESRPYFTTDQYFSGEYMLEWEEYITDHVPKRDEFLGLVDYLEQIIKCPFGETIRIVKAQNVLVLPDRVRELYRYDNDIAKQYVDIINGLAVWMPEEITMYHMLIPMPIAFEEEKYQVLSDNQQESITSIYQRLDKRIHTIDAYTVLETHNEEAIYFRTDHHWTALGARYGAEAFAKVSQLTLPDLHEYQCYSLTDYIGHLGKFHMWENTECISDDVDYYLYHNQNNIAERYYYNENGEKVSFTAAMIHTNYAEGKGHYGIFLSGDYPYVVINGDAQNGRVLAILKDSYGNAFAPWLATEFEQIICIDPRSCQEDLAVLLNKYNVTDFLILNYLQATILPEYCKSMYNILPKT